MASNQTSRRLALFVFHNGLRPPTSSHVCPRCKFRSNLANTAPNRSLLPRWRSARTVSTSSTASHVAPKPRMARFAAPATAAAVSGIIALITLLRRPEGDTASRDADSQKGSPVAVDDRDPSFPRFRLADVRKHDSSSEHPWVTHEDKVYDITDWIPAHPGGDVILRAAGGSIDPYWDIFKIHKSPHVYDILAQYQIGYIDLVDLVDGRPPTDAIEDPFQDDPIRDIRLITHTVKPRNAEPPNEELEKEFHTANELFYVRNHMWVPVVQESEAENHVLTIELPDGETAQYTLADLRERFPAHRVTAVLQCSGNRRNDMTIHATKTNGLQWGVGAISNAVWEGVRLADILADAGLRTTAAGQQAPPPSAGEDEDSIADPNTHHVQFSGLEAYGASIPLSTALDPRADVLLAFGMNGAPLPRDHGYPLRAVVPGHVAARSVKWLSKIVVSDEESPSQWQRRDYKSFGPNEGANPDWDRAPAIQEMPITSAITSVWVGDSIRNEPPWPQAKSAPGPTGSARRGSESPNEPIAVQGYAYSGGGRAICRVDVSLDGGKTWDQAELLDDVPVGGSKQWAWKRWRYAGKLTPAAAAGQCTTLVVKATDDSYNTQPEHHTAIYNVRGNLATAWHRVRICPVRREEGMGKKGNGSLEWRAYGCGFAMEPKEEAKENSSK